MSITPMGSLASPVDTDTLRLSQDRGMNLGGMKRASPEKIDAVAKEFESVFISQMLESMFATVDIKESLGGSDAEETFQSMMVTEYGKVIARAGGLGIADQIKRDMLKLQEVK